MGLTNFLTKRSKMTNSKHKEDFKIIPLKNLCVSKTNPRLEFSAKLLGELADSIKTHGVIQPIIVRRNGVPEDKFEIVSGERRFKACELAGEKNNSGNN